MADAAAVAVARGSLTEVDTRRFLDEVISRLADGAFLMLMPMVAVAGTKPGP